MQPAKKHVLSILVRQVKEKHDWISQGKLFHTLVPDTEKAWSP